jgi:hypothetical protein
MSQRKKNTPKVASADEHLDTLGEMLAQLKTHLTESGEKKGSYADYLRLLEFYRETRGVEVKQVIVGWVDNLNRDTEPIAA